MLPDHLRALTNWQGYVSLHNLAISFPKNNQEIKKGEKIILSFYEMQKPYGVIMSPDAKVYGISATVSGCV